jgi:hypothetical protein
MALKIVTIGVYGFNEAGFFATLKKAEVDSFCDLRARRAVRGSACAFANSQRLQRRLAELGIRYLHFPELAPSAELRAKQAAADKADRKTKRQRSVLSPDFVSGYEDEVLKPFRTADFLTRVGPGARVIALFCVEGEPAACHRSLLAARLQRDLNVGVDHLVPG